MGEQDTNVPSVTEEEKLPMAQFLFCPSAIVILLILNDDDNHDVGLNDPMAFCFLAQKQQHRTNKIIC